MPIHCARLTLTIVSMLAASGGLLRGHAPVRNTLALVADAPQSTGTIFVASMEESQATAFDAGIWQPRATVPTGKGPHEVRVSPDGRRAYVVAGATITAIDVATGRVAATLDLGSYSAHDVRISRDGQRLWAACARQQTILELSSRTGQVLAQYQTGQDGAWFVEVGADEAKLYTSNLEGKSVSVIARATGAVKVLPLEHPAYGIDITPDGREVWVSGRGLVVIDTATDTIARRIETPVADTGRIRITPDGRSIVVAMARALDLYDAATGQRRASIPLDAEPKVLALSADGTRALLTNPDAQSMTVVDLVSRTVERTVSTGRRPDGIAWAPVARS